jgi:hypothetical protein
VPNFAFGELDRFFMLRDCRSDYQLQRRGLLQKDKARGTTFKLLLATGFRQICASASPPPGSAALHHHHR